MQISFFLFLYYPKIKLNLNKISLVLKTNPKKKKTLATTNTYLLISTNSISPENEKNSLMSCCEAPKETLLTLTVVTCHDKQLKGLA